MSTSRACPVFLARSFLVASLTVLFSARGSVLAASPSVGVAVLHAAPWSVGDSTREGAGELEVLLRVAQLQRAHRVVGIISIGNHRGMRPCGGERALSYAALSGIPVVKKARDGEVAPSPEGLYVDAGSLSEEQAKLALERCLQRFGPPPTAADPENPTKREIRKIRAHLLQFREAFQLPSGPRSVAHLRIDPRTE